MGLLPWRGSRGSSQVGVDSRNKLLKKGEERKRGELEGEGGVVVVVDSCAPVRLPTIKVS